jgi:cytochrome c oxidase accessory protein FixG
MPRHLPIASAGTGSLLADGSRPFIAPADVTGRFARWRRLVGVACVVLGGALPWIKMNGAPALFVDIATRRLFAFGHTFNAQDTPLLFFVVTGIGLSLFVITTLFGRVWCGWACPQTVVMDIVFRPVERLIDGSREARMKREAGPWNADRTLRFVAKHLVFVALAVALAHGVLAFFVSAPGVLALVHGSPWEHAEAFWWAFGMSVVIYVQFAWFREQLCLVVCPYGRLQAALVDDDTVTIGYDAVRGEPRGHVGTTKGDCVDCGRCVVVCPTAIDIRKGLQLDCVACTACIDACDAVMAKLARPAGLIRYDSLNAFSGKKRRVLRPRLGLYAGLGLVWAILAVGVTSGRHTDAEIAVLRLPGTSYELDAGRVRNALDVHLVSKRSTGGTYTIDVVAPAGTDVVQPIHEVKVGAMQGVHVPLFVTIARDFHGPRPVLKVSARRDGSDEVISSEIPILGTTP